MRRFWAASAGVLFAYLALGLSEGVLPLHFADGFDQRGLGLLYMAMSVAVAFAAGAAARYRPRLMVVLSTVLVSIGLGFAAATPAPSYWIVALLVAGVGIGIGTTGSTGCPPRDRPTRTDRHGHHRVVRDRDRRVSGWPAGGGCHDPDPRLLGVGADSARGRSGDRGNAGLGRTRAHRRTLIRAPAGTALAPLRQCSVTWGIARNVAKHARGARGREGFNNPNHAAQRYS